MTPNACITTIIFSKLWQYAKISCICENFLYLRWNTAIKLRNKDYWKTCGGNSNILSFVFLFLNFSDTISVKKTYRIVVIIKSAAAWQMLGFHRGISKKVIAAVVEII
jgi:hypothetical protein